ncbi:GNAT family N-acetyltransferase [Sutcliffiella halmapala]|uniref:GNAT family N-acetyltransferase n=1 Tax=Sutcliffiella halmapala TaxID=79882 RepID=UPI000994C357|nr:GNAT family N-acetyltransferase [Sutcliffiella halmapala]
MTIHKATLDQLEELGALFDLYRVFYEQQTDIEGAKGFLKERIMNEESVIFLAFDNGIAVGFTQLYPTFSSVKMKRTWVLNDLFVNEKARGKGFGEKLVNEAIAFANETGASGVLLETAQDNVNAQRLYEKIGFVKEENYFYFYSV